LVDCRRGRVVVASEKKVNRMYRNFTPEGPAQILLGPPTPVEGGVMRCMSLACEHAGGCQPIGMTNSYPPKPIYPPDCTTGLLTDQQPPLQLPATGDGGPTAGQTSPGLLSSVSGLFEGMSTTTLLLLGGAAWFLFFRKKR
jgi:hypothetical protein